MPRRVRIGRGASSPFLVSVAGVDADTATFENLIFNGNQPPLRLWGTGYIVAAANTSGGSLPLPLVTPGLGVIATPAGTYPVYMLAGRASGTAGSTDPSLTTTFHNLGGVQNGWGGMISGNQFFGLVFNDPNGPVGTINWGPSLVNYCIFKNYG